MSMQLVRNRWISACALLFLCHCGGVEASRDFTVSDGLMPPEGQGASVPLGTTDDPYPQTSNMTQGTDGNDVGWVNIVGYVHAPLNAVWEATKNHDVLVDNRPSRVDEWSSVPCSTDDKFAFCMVLKNTTHAFVKVEFDITWKHALLTDNDDTVDGVNIAYQFTRVEPASLGAISTLEGHFVLDAVTDNITRVWMFSRLLVAQENPQREVVSFASLVFDRLQQLGTPASTN